MTEEKKADLESTESTGTKYFNEIFEQFEELTSKSQYEQYYETHGDEDKEQWKPTFHHVTDLSSESDCEPCKYLEAEIKLYKYFGIGRFNKQFTEEELKKCKCLPQIAMLTPTDDVALLSISENRHEPDSKVKVTFVCDDRCSLKEEDIRDEKDEPNISGVDYLKYYTEKLKYNAAIDESSNVDSIQQNVETEDTDDENEFANPTDFTNLKHFASKVVPKSNAKVISKKKMDVKHPPSPSSSTNFDFDDFPVNTDTDSSDNFS